MVDFYSPPECLYILATTPRLQRICRHFLHSSMLFLSCDMLRINACALFMGLVSFYLFTITICLGSVARERVAGLTNGKVSKL